MASHCIFSPKTNSDRFGAAAVCFVTMWFPFPLGNLLCVLLGAAHADFPIVFQPETYFSNSWRR